MLSVLGPNTRTFCQAFLDFDWFMETFPVILVLTQGCATGGPRATTRPANPFSMALANTLIFPYHA